MSGHSKWHNIQKTKGAQDAKRAAAFTKIAKEMIVAVKEGGGATDPAYNSRLATIITKAKAANMPNDNIKRVLEKAASAGSGESYESITYEGYGPGGVAVIVETMTDNRNRTAGSVRHHFDKYGGNLGANGCVSWSFDKKGVLVIDNEDGDLDEDTVMMDAMDCGADDFEPEEDCFTVYTTPDDFNAVADVVHGVFKEAAAVIYFYHKAAFCIVSVENAAAVGIHHDVLGAGVHAQHADILKLFLQGSNKSLCPCPSGFQKF